MPEMMEELSLDDQIAIAIATAQVRLEPSEKRVCQYDGVGVPLANANKGEYCFRHSQIEQAMKLEKILMTEQRLLRAIWLMCAR